MSAPRTRTLSRLARHLILGCGAAGLLLGILEGALRIYGFKYHLQRPILMWNDVTERRLEWLDGIYRFHPYWFWEPRPGTRVARFWERMPPATHIACAGERINKAGFRGPERPRSPAPGNLRIVTIGDSSTFGMGVCWEDTFAAILEREIPNVEVLNFGVIGFSAFQGVQLLERRILQYRPRLVLVAFGALNELLPAGAYDVDAKFRITSRSSPTAVLWQDRLSGLRTFQLIVRALAKPPDHSFERKRLHNLEQLMKGSRDYLRNQSVASFERSLERIIGLVRSRGARVALIGPPRRRAVEARWPWANEYSIAIERVSERLDVPFWDARAAFRAAPVSDETLFLDDVHPTVTGHRLYARFLAEKILHDLGPPPREAHTR